MKVQMHNRWRHHRKAGRNARPPRLPRAARTLETAPPPPRGMIDHLELMQITGETTIPGLMTLVQQKKIHPACLRGIWWQGGWQPVMWWNRKDAESDVARLQEMIAQLRRQ